MSPPGEMRSLPLPGLSEDAGWHFLSREKDREEEERGILKDGEKMKILRPNCLVAGELVSQMERGNEPPG